MVQFSLKESVIRGGMNADAAIQRYENLAKALAIRNAVLERDAAISPAAPIDALRQVGPPAADTSSGKPVAAPRVYKPVETWSLVVRSRTAGKTGKDR